jgi:hypothetical protein
MGNSSLSIPGLINFASMRFQLLKFLATLAFVCQVLSMSNGLTDLVTWDEYSLSVSGERVFIK